MTFAEVARDSLFRMLELVQLDRRGAAAAMVLELRFVADEATREDLLAVAGLARRGAAAAERWAGGSEVNEARAEVVKVIAALFRELEIELR